jgi:hypothetical protein
VHNPACPGALQRSHAPSQGSPQQTPSTQFPFWQLAPLVHGVPTPPR